MILRPMPGKTWSTSTSYSSRFGDEPVAQQLSQSAGCPIGRRRARRAPRRSCPRAATRKVRKNARLACVTRKSGSSTSSGSRTVSMMSSSKRSAGELAAIGGGGGVSLREILSLRVIVDVGVGVRIGPPAIDTNGVEGPTTGHARRGGWPTVVAGGNSARSAAIAAAFSRFAHSSLQWRRPSARRHRSRSPSSTTIASCARHSRRCSTGLPTSASSRTAVADAAFIAETKPRRLAARRRPARRGQPARRRRAQQTSSRHEDHRDGSHPDERGHRGVRERRRVAASCSRTPRSTSSSRRSGRSPPARRCCRRE